MKPVPQLALSKDGWCRGQSAGSWSIALLGDAPDALDVNAKRHSV